MPRTPSLAIKDDSAEPGRWVLNIPASMSPDGKLHRRYFRDKEDAEAAAAKLRSQYHKGIRGGTINPVLAEQALRAAELLKPYSISLIEVVQAYVRKAEQVGTKTFKQQWKAFVAKNEDRWSSTYRAQIEALERILPKWFQSTPLADIDAATIRRALEAKSSAESTIETRGRHVAAVIAGKSRKKREKLPVILTDEQVEGLLGACEGKQETQAMAILMFAGIRPSTADGEITRLLWSDFDLRKRLIDVRAEVSKTGSERLVPIKPRLLRLLKGAPKSGTVIPANWKRRYARIRKAAGLGKGHHDATRHTFASHFLAAYGETPTQAAMGHAEGSRTLFRHYRRAVTQAAGKAYFK